MTASRVAEIDWNLPTPCTDWTLRDLTEHVTGGNRFTIRILSGDTSDDAMASARRSFVDDHDTREGLVTSTLDLNEAPGKLFHARHPNESVCVSRCIGARTAS